MFLQNHGLFFFLFPSKHNLLNFKLKHAVLEIKINSQMFQYGVYE